MEAAIEAAEDDEWEYEYDDNETEDFYITVDMSSVPKTNDKSAPSEPNQLASVKHGMQRAIN